MDSETLPEISDYKHCVSHQQTHDPESNHGLGKVENCSLVNNQILI